MASRIRATRSAHITFGILLVGSVILLAAIALPIWKPLFMAAVLAAVISPANEWLAHKLRGRRQLATAITILLVIVVLLIPLVTLAAVIVDEAIDAYAFVRTTLAQGGLQGLIDELPDMLQKPLHDLIELMPPEQTLSDQAMAGGRVAAGLFTSAVSEASNLAFGLVLMLVALHALLLYGRDMVAWLERVSPLPETGELLAETRQVSGFVIRSSFVTALLQAGVATIGFLIASVPNPVFFGMLTFLAAFIPSIGTALITFPMVGLLVLSGYVWQPIFLGIWALVAIGLIDNVVLPLLIRDGVHLNGVAIFFALIGGLIAFGGIGLIVGPLALALFLAMSRFAYRDYIEHPQPLAPPLPKTSS